MKIGDDVTINGKIISIIPTILNKNNSYVVRLNSGIDICIHEQDINTVRPSIKTDGVDHRKGN